MAKDYNQEKGINFDETFASVARIKAIRMLLAILSFIGKLCQMDVKCAFLNGYLQENLC